MSLLNDDELFAALDADIQSIADAKADAESWEVIVSMAHVVEQAVIRKLATVSVEPVGEVVEYNDYGFPWKRIQYTYDSEIAELPLGTKVYTAEALSAARVQALEDAGGKT